MAPFEHIQSCLDVTDEDIARAMAPAEALEAPSPRQKMLALAQHMAGIARPDEGASRILLVMARMALRDWVEGDLVVRAIGDDEVTVLQIMVDDGVSMERMTSPLRVDAPYAEFRAAVETNVDPFLPLGLDGAVEGRGFTLRAKRRAAFKRAPSYSALALDLVKDMSGRIAIEPGRNPPPSPSPRKQEPASERKEPALHEPVPAAPRRIASWDKLPAIVEFPDDEKKR